MATLTTAHVRALLTPPAKPCVSLYLPTHVQEPVRREDPIRYKNLVRKADELLRAQLPGSHVQELLRPFEALTADTAFWSSAHEGLAAFGAPGFFEVHRLPRSVREAVVVADSFHLKPLLRITQSADRFQVLGVTRTEVFLYEGNRYQLDRLETDGLIPTFGEAVGTDLTAPGHHPGEVEPPRGHKVSRVEIGQNTTQFFQAVDRAVRERVSEPSKLPLVLVALPDHQAEFRKISQNRFLLPTGVATDPGALTAEKLRADVWQVVEPRYLDRLARLNNDYGTAVSRQKGSGLLTDVALAGRDGRIGVLLVDADKTIPGTYDQSSGAVRFETAGTPGVDDLIDDMAEATLRSGGDVVVVPHDKMPSETGLAAIYRF